MATAIKAAARECGMDPSRYSTHSVRIGGAAALLNAGADHLAIKGHGSVDVKRVRGLPYFDSSGLVWFG
ncbi:hypothetical protein JG687_00007334 [Phytophthora cactorum]|uniref:Uncharacterized protein n=1 Tax=Phytophthora cactorum TaxID=29920 RepID=A0A8T1CPY0_9STRA|nr:hypothetical protein PC114_g16471 [Phytophthora cactorum]KAG2925770.1 hypothetical protein PC117_g15100 [Phytophthora cactorum]KAG3149723.1 hypothetical protein C6341_g16953 [Phytophthora cactorum]KAG4233252.1 hypothetical protein PC116_g18543 [Phytophthora cactorum]KAG6962058.1 hypothetical protein JG687_00007334 [Phytophthora cactorum]